jgi:antitoxin component of MazEF toxin-antitoxin module
MKSNPQANRELARWLKRHLRKKRSPAEHGLLARLVAQVTPENRHEETDWGLPQGREIWWSEKREQPPQVLTEK